MSQEIPAGRTMGSPEGAVVHHPVGAAATADRTAVVARRAVVALVVVAVPAGADRATALAAAARVVDGVGAPSVVAAAVVGSVGVDGNIDDARHQGFSSGCAEEWRKKRPQNPSECAK